MEWSILDPLLEERPGLSFHHFKRFSIAGLQRESPEQETGGILRASPGACTVNGLKNLARDKTAPACHQLKPSSIISTFWHGC
jgi:hypothetical protein